jgi:cytochrome c oxidase subunit 1
MYNETLAKISVFLVFIGFNMTFFTQFFLGSQGMPRRYYNYLDQYQPLHAFSSVGSWVLGLGFIIMAFYLIHSLFKGKPAPENPWGALTLEWKTTSPPIHHNFEETPEIDHEPYDYDTRMVIDDKLIKKEDTTV